MTDVELQQLHNNTWNNLTVCKKLAQNRLKYYQKMCLQIIYIIYMYKQDLALNNWQWLIFHKIKQNQTKPIIPT